MLGNNSSSNYDYAQDSSEKRKHERERDHRNNRGSADGARPAGRAHHSRDHKDEQQAKAAKDDQKANRHHSNKVRSIYSGRRNKFMSYVFAFLIRN